MYVEASSPRKPGDKAVMESPRIPITGDRCYFEFWYHMYGSGIGQLIVNLETSYGYANNLLTLTGDQGDRLVKLSISRLTHHPTILGLYGRAYYFPLFTFSCD